MKTKIAVALTVMVIFSVEGCAMNLNLDKIAQQNSISPDHPDYVLIDIISRPLAKKGSVVPQSTGGFHHLAIVSDLLPNGIWEMGPGRDGGKITIFEYNKNDKGLFPGLSLQGDTPLNTMEAIGSKQVLYSQWTNVSESAFGSMVSNYRTTWTNQPYVGGSFNSNYAVNSWIYGSGGQIQGLNTIRPSFAGEYYEGR